MSNLKPLIAVLLTCLVLFGCSDKGLRDPEIEKEVSKDTQLEFQIIASEKTLPENFYDLAFEREAPPFFHYLVKKVENETEFVETWEQFAFEQDPPNTDLFRENDVLFIGLHESGSCALEIENITLSPNNKTMTASMKEPNGACTDDATPRTFVIEIEKMYSRNIEDVVIVHSGVDTDVPF